MKNQKKTKRHHFVPRCYLKNFLRDGELYALDIKKVINGIPHKVKRVQPAGICYIEDYYTIHPNEQNSQFKLDGLNELFIESEVLTVLEEKYDKHLYPKLIADDSLPFSEACDLSDFILQLKFRNPFHLETMNAKMPATIDEVLDGIFERTFNENHRFAHLPAQVRKAAIDKLRRDSKEDPLFSKKMQLSRLAENKEDNKESRKVLTKALLNAGWWIYQSPETGPYFITSDNPGFSIGKDALNYDTKFVDGFAFHFPISPTCCLVISDAEKDSSFDKNDSVKNIKRFNVNDRAVIEINNRAIQQVNKLLIASDDWYLLQIAEINRERNKKA